MSSRTDLQPAPRLVVAGASGDAGKTTVSLGLIRAFRSRGLVVQPFKKGPDYIDPAWLTRAAGRVARNLDVRLFGENVVQAHFDRYAPQDGISVIEGNRGLYDGGDAQGTHSTASLARLLSAPVVLVVDATKVTRTAAAVVLGCQRLEPQTPLAGVILNRVAGSRHRRVVTEAIEQATGLRVYGALPRRRGDMIASRHLGLLTPEEHGAAEDALEVVRQWVEDHVDVAALVELAQGAPSRAMSLPLGQVEPAGQGVTIGVLRDASLSFYYPENIEALEALGARVVTISPLRDERLPSMDALYVGGGFPETHAKELSSNRALLGEIRQRIAGGLSVYAECGGLIYMSSKLWVQGQAYDLVGALPLELQMEPRPVGHGYVDVQVSGDTTFYEKGQKLSGHEFHYSRIIGGLDRVERVFRVMRGGGVDGE
ncbi:MAG TPA: cobyrinate a,c-diamide synthase, partial [Polyangiaceae bacterium]|nr:cobyrinate a,c-diamide synthase [Polyangiaceae bacterium]